MATSRQGLPGLRRENRGPLHTGFRCVTRYPEFLIHERA